MVSGSVCRILVLNDPSYYVGPVRVWGSTPDKCVSGVDATDSRTVS